MTPRIDRRQSSWVRDNSLSIVFGVLLLLALTGQAVAGVAQYNREARTAGLQASRSATT